jgi:hypothetical protein
LDGSTLVHTAYIHFGDPELSGTVDLSDVDVIFSDDAVENQNGDALKPYGLGDLNGDGYDELCLATATDDDEDGELFVFLGSASPQGYYDGDIFSNADIRPSGSYQSRYGTAVVTLGDATGDGLADWAMGGPTEDDATDEWTNEGEVTWHAGTNQDSNWRSDFGTIYGAGAADRVGESLAGPGDWNGDGYADLFIGAPEVDGGAVYLVLGRPLQE